VVGGNLAAAQKASSQVKALFWASLILAIILYVGWIALAAQNNTSS
jgi:hypothetical protein